MTTEENLRRLVDRAKEYDSDALSEIYELLADSIYRYVLVRVRNKEVAEDITGQSFLKMLEGLDRFEWKGGGLRSWLFRIAHNLIVDSFRGERGTVYDNQSGDIERSAERSAIINETLSEALETMEALNANQRQVVMLRLICGLSCRETADALAISEGNVRILQHRALNAIRKQLRVEVNV